MTYLLARLPVRAVIDTHSPDPRALPAYKREQPRLPLRLLSLARQIDQHPVTNQFQTGWRIAACRE